LEETLNLQGIPIVLVDTAGIAAEAADPIEQLGIERSQRALAQADLGKLVVDASRPVSTADGEIAALVGNRPAIVVQNKIDLATDEEVMADRLPSPRNAPCPLPGRPCVPVSALTGEGLEDLESAIVAQVLSGQVAASEAPLVTSPRHKDALQRAADTVNDAMAAMLEGQSAIWWPSMGAAVNALGEITGGVARISRSDL
jgi:tRNA modification GTPase